MTWCAMELSSHLHTYCMIAARAIIQGIPSSHEVLVAIVHTSQASLIQIGLTHLPIRLAT